MRKTLVLLLSALIYCSVSGQGTLVDFNTIPKSGTILVLSHMDDDVIWMLPWWKKVEKFISGAMPSASRFVTVVDQQQAYLDANNYNIDYKSNWIMPWGTITMKEYSDYYWDNLPASQYLAVDHLIAYWDNSDLALVRTEVNRIKAKMEQYIADPAVTRIVTHNNWGEYGHQHHKAVNKAMRELAVKYRKDVWMLGCDNGDFEDIDVPNGVTYTVAPFNDPTLFTSIRTIYKNNWCWTWPDTIPSGDHKFIKVVDGGSDKSNLLTGETVAVSGPVQDQPGAYIFDGIDDFMTKWGIKTSSFTIAMRVRPDVIKSMDISKMTEYPGNDTTDRNLYLNSNGTVSARIFDGSSKVVTSTTSLAANTWTHVVMTGDGTSLRIYINGLLENTIPAGSAITSYVSPEFVMGQTAMTSSFFSGQLNDVKLYDRALTDNEIAALSGVKYTIDASVTGTGGTISPSGQVSVIVGSNSTFSITATGSYKVSDVLVDNVSVGAVTSYTFTTVKANHTISATFVPTVIHTITVSPGDNGTITPSGQVVVGEGSNQTFSIAGNIGYQVSDVLVDGASVGAVSSYTFSNITADHTISATFASGQTYTIIATAGSGGTISPSGSVAANQGTSPVFTITPATGFRILSVLVDNASVGAVTSYTFTNIAANHTIAVTFSAIPTYTLTASAGSGGSISPSGSVSAKEGTSSTFTITPATGYAISSVLVDNVPVGTVPSYTFSNITANHTISASFVILTFPITSSAGTGGTISPSGSVSVNYGSGKTFTITPDAGYSISNVSVDNVSMGALTSYTFSNVTSAHTISATFSILTYTITAGAGAGGTISPSGSVSVTYGSGSTFTITPDAAYSIANVLVDNVSAGAVSTYTFSNVTGNHTISVTFAIKTYTLTASSGTGGSVSPAGTTTLNYGSGQTYSITPATGYNISDVLIDNVSAGAVSTYSFTNVTSSHTISATFSRNTYTISATTGTGGTITPSGTQTVSYGNNQSFTISPDYGYQISNVKADNVSLGAVSSYTFSNVTANHSISATFILLKYNITASAGTGGSISPAGQLTLNHGSSQTYTIVPDTGFGIADVKVDGSTVGAVSEYTFNGITGGHTITATFSVLSYTLTGSAGTGGSISPEGETSAEYGTNQSFTITPETGYNISDVKVDDISIGAVDSYTFTNVTSAHTISASFVLKTFMITVTPGANGSIAPEGNAEVSYGSSRSFTITPAEGYRISDVRVDNISIGAVDSYDFENVVSDHTISADFEFINLYTISSDAGSGGTITPQGTITIPEESNQTYEITPESGYRILKVIVDDHDLGEVSSYTFTSVEANHSIKAEFTTETTMTVYPSPFTDEFKVRIETPMQGTFDMFVFDGASRVVYSRNELVGNNITTVNLKSFPKGIYVIRLYHKNVVVGTVKVIKI